MGGARKLIAEAFFDWSRIIWWSIRQTRSSPTNDPTAASIELIMYGECTRLAAGSAAPSPR